MNRLEIVDGNAEAYIQSPKRPRSIDYAIPIYKILSEYGSTIYSLMTNFNFILVWKFKEGFHEYLEYSANSTVETLSAHSWKITSKDGKHYAIVKMFSDEEPVSGDACV